MKLKTTILIFTLMFLGFAHDQSAYTVEKAADTGKSVTESEKDSIDWEDLLGERLGDFETSAYKDKNVSFQGGYSGQCTWYCLGRAYEKTGRLITVAPNAKKWLSIKLPKGAKFVKDGEKVRANAIAVVTTTKYGHVMYVEAVQDGWVYYTEANVPMDNKIDAKDGTVRRQKLSDFTSRVGGYIYLD